ncbi:GGDEF domain-containing protein [Vibrio aerogenes]|nr:GGDEF domain-containing protein [Vibrio aerogenes]
MNEVAYIDIPLNQIMSEVEMIQLERHILFEQFKLKEKLPKEKKTPHQEFVYQKQQLKLLLDKAVNVIAENLVNHKIRFERHEHQHLLEVIEAYHVQSDRFEKKLAEAISHESIPSAERYQLEETSTQLESAVNSILQQLDEMTFEAGRYAEKHEQEFLFVNTALGVCALLLGLFLTIYTIYIFRQRINKIQDGIQNMDFSIEQGYPALGKEIFQVDGPGDELSELEQELMLLMQRLTKEITNREQVEKQLLQMVTQDKLTGAFNRHKWDEQVLLHLDLARRGSFFSLILLDIDYFKQINDEYGHQVGDQVLQNLVHRLSTGLRKTDMLFRLGGEEFAILLPVQEASSACMLAERLRILVCQDSDEGLPSYTVSIGVTSYQEEDTEESVFQRADKALYQAKSSGRNQICQI